MNQVKPLKWLIKRSKKQALKMGLLVFANAFLSILSVAFAFVIKEIVDSATLHNDKNRLFIFAIVNDNFFAKKVKFGLKSVNFY